MIRSTTLAHIILSLGRALFLKLAIVGHDHGKSFSNSHSH